MITTRQNWWGLRPWQRHSLVLLVAGLVYIGIGISMISDEPSQHRLSGLVVAVSIMSLDWWGIIFVVAGVLSVLSARWPPFADTWGYMVLTGLSAAWASVYALAFIFENAPKSNITATMVWALVAFLWWAISGLLNPDRIAVVSNGPD